MEGWYLERYPTVESVLNKGAGLVSGAMLSLSAPEPPTRAELQLKKREIYRGEGILDDPRLKSPELMDHLLEEIPESPEEQVRLAQQLDFLFYILDINNYGPEECRAFLDAILRIDYDKYFRERKKWTLALADILHRATDFLCNRLEVGGEAADRALSYFNSIVCDFSSVHDLPVYWFPEEELVNFQYRNPLYRGEPLYLSRYRVFRTGMLDIRTRGPLRKKEHPVPGCPCRFDSAGLAIDYLPGDTMGEINFSPWDIHNTWNFRHSSYLRDDENRGIGNIPPELLYWAWIRGTQNLVHSIDNGRILPEELPQVLLFEARRDLRDRVTMAYHFGFRPYTAEQLDPSQSDPRFINMIARSEEFLERIRSSLNEKESIQKLRDDITVLQQENPEGWVSPLYPNPKIEI